MFDIFVRREALPAFEALPAPPHGGVLLRRATVDDPVFFMSA
jgi:hypothetical protein